MKLGESNGWLLLGDSHFDEQYAALADAAEKLKKSKPEIFESSNIAKKYRMVTLLVEDIIPIDPSGIQYRLGKTLRSDYKHWRRAKFFQQYRLFFRYDSHTKIIIYSWFNDESTLRSYGSKYDAYAIFEKMLNCGNPPTTWLELLESIKE
jgi:toxin YhaV